jgi:hypothetical protein
VKMSRVIWREERKMSRLSNRITKHVYRNGGRAGIALLLLLLVSTLASAQSWSWTYEMIDLPATFPSLAVDSNSNLHVSYADSSGALKYGFRPAGSSRWFTMILDKQLGGFTTHLTLDAKNDPHICYTPGMIKYARWDGHEWRIQQIAKDSGEIGYTCSIVIAKDGTPHLSWYQLTGPLLLRIRYAVRKDSSWLVRTLDFDHETGKWNSMVLDAHDDPLLSYSAWVDGELRLAHWNGKEWSFTTVDSRTRSRGEYNIGQGNSLILDPDGKGHISFYSEKALKYAHQVDDGWKVETIDQINWLGSWTNFRSSIVLDKQHFPHICYEDAGVLKHAYWDGKKWQKQVLARSGFDTFRYSSMAIDRDDNLYIAFRDAEDNTLKLATGRPTAAPLSTASKDDQRSEAPPKQN